MITILKQQQNAGKEVQSNIFQEPMCSGSNSNDIISFVIGCGNSNLYAHNEICFPLPLVPYFWSPHMLCPYIC